MNILKRWLAAAATAVILFANPAQATEDEASNGFRLTNAATVTARIRCGLSGSWTSVAPIYSVDIACSESSA